MLIDPKTFATDPQTLFDSQTHSRLINQWFYGMDEGRAEVEIDLKPGGKYTINMVNLARETVATPHGEILEIDPPHNISTSWLSEGFVNHSILTFELEPLVKAQN